MKILSVLTAASSLICSCAIAAQKPSPEDIAFAERFKGFSTLGVTLNHLPAAENPWGSPNPDSPPELNQFAFMVGKHECVQPLTGINPNNPSQVLENDFLWLAYYALDGRAIRDEFYSMTSNGEQTRAYDPYTEEWQVTWATVPSVVSLSPEPKPNSGSFKAVQIDGNMVMTSPATDSNGVEYTNTVTFFDIEDNGFKWKAENVFADRSVETSKMTCKKVDGPDWQ